MSSLKAQPTPARKRSSTLPSNFNLRSTPSDPAILSHPLRPPNNVLQPINPNSLNPRVEPFTPTLASTLGDNKYADSIWEDGASTTATSCHAGIDDGAWYENGENAFYSQYEEASTAQDILITTLLYQELPKNPYMVMYPEPYYLPMQSFVGPTQAQEALVQSSYEDYYPNHWAYRAEQKVNQQAVNVEEEGDKEQEKVKKTKNKRKLKKKGEKKAAKAADDAAKLDIAKKSGEPSSLAG